ncbi:uncharacterized protein CLUP02_04609 [Colletotrichum lupini]|uniref:Uncharacterized protein n=1 Tax=Colletotrichum lupini TaxID=145971 RepID=A0A9Q8WDX8_9PEZI|nr:uncharacterized protein CLUP02_04609 [Colletotrichum lupini]UQC79130.1 hypothetical protein CLUP02_04609 [Colletotrichum lupini]
MSQPIGLTTIPRLLPVTGTFALPFTIYYAFLSLRVVNERLKSKQYLGDNSSKPGADPESYKANALYLAGRSHVNYIENVPLAFILASLIEVNGGNRKTLSWLLGSFFALRVLHAELGIMKPEGMGKGRPIGYFGSIGVLDGLKTSKDKKGQKRIILLTYAVKLRGVLVSTAASPLTPSIRFTWVYRLKVSSHYLVPGQFIVTLGGSIA